MGAPVCHWKEKWCLTLKTKQKKYAPHYRQMIMKKYSFSKLNTTLIRCALFSLIINSWYVLCPILLQLSVPGNTF